MGIIVKGADVAAKMKEAMKADIEKYNLKPCLTIVRVGEKPSDLSYEKGVVKTAESVGIEVRKLVLDESIQQEEFEK